MTSAEQLIKYKNLKNKVMKDFKKGKAGYMGFTIDVCYGGNKEPDLSRISLGGISCREGVSQEFLDLIVESIDSNIDFWQNAVLKDIEKLKESLK